MSIELALADAAKNCAERAALTVVTLRSGVQLIGYLKRTRVTDTDTRTIDTLERGWITFRVDEIAAVESKHGA